MASAVNERQIARAKDEARTDALTDREVVSNLMAHPRGRRWIWNLLSGCMVFNQLFDAGPGGNAKMCFREGRRSIGLEMLDKVMRYAPKSYVLMLEENNPGVKLSEEEDNDRSVTDGD